jgi:hypothetical protein
LWVAVQESLHLLPYATGPGAGFTTVARGAFAAGWPIRKMPGMHRITGPYRGYFVAAYTVKAKAGGYAGYGKACVERPTAAWRAQARADVVSSLYPDELQALVAAEHKVRLEIDQLPPSWDPFTAPGELRPE